jgi:hypothetical protein
MTFGIPNDENIIFFERVNPGDQYENAFFEETVEEIQGEVYDPDDPDIA